MLRQKIKLLFTIISSNIAFSSIALVGLIHAEESFNMLTEPNPVWHQCNSAQDCTLIRGFCGYPEAVNSKYADTYRLWIKVGPPAHCALLAPVKKVCITCEKQKCFARSVRSNKKDKSNTDLKELIKKLDSN